MAKEETRPVRSENDENVEEFIVRIADDDDPVQQHDKLREAIHGLPDAHAFASFPLFARRVARTKEPPFLRKSDKEKRLRGTWEDARKRLREARVPSLDRFFRVSRRVVRGLIDDDLEKRLRDFPQKRRVPTPGPAPQTVPQLELEHEQCHLDPGVFGGVDARFAWGLPGGRGEHVTVCVLDKHYRTGHEDLPPFATVQTPYAVPDPNDEHGTCVMGILAATAQNAGVTGICPAAGMMFCSTAAYNFAEDPVNAWKNGGVRALDHVLGKVENGQPLLDWGDVIVLEMQTKTYYPIEYEPDIRLALRTAALVYGITVVGAAANGGSDLTTVDAPDIEDLTKDEKIWSATGTANDSYSVLVGAGNAPAECHQVGGAGWHERMNVSNYGARVTCQGWGENIVTTGGDVLFDPADPRERGYTRNFGDTSGAAPMVAGVVACVQSIVQNAGYAPLDPAYLRELLHDPSVGSTPANGDGGTPIGPLPDLYKILCSLGFCPAITMRASLADDGSVPFAGDPVDASPDIVTRQAMVGDPAAVFVDDEWDADPSQPVRYGQTSYVYVRFRNGDDAAPDEVEAHLYLADASTLLDPSSWTELKHWPAVDAQPDTPLVTDEPFAWDAAAIPAPGSYHLIASADSVRDRLHVPVFADADEFEDFVRQTSNVCARAIVVQPV